MSVLDDDDVVIEESDAAATEAASIGGSVDSYGVSEADRAVAEGGGGVSEGFEVAEEALIENAEHQSGLGDPIGDAMTPEVESDRTGVEYADVDEIEENK